MSFEKSRKCLIHDLPAHRGIYLPKHMIPPGQDGYRTPTVEDYERHAANGVQREHNQSSKSNCDPPARQFTPNSGTSGKHHPNLSSLNISYMIGEKLQWKERIRHFTWTFFTITMSTGGIANVISNGTLLISSWTDRSPANVCGSAISVSRP